MVNLDYVKKKKKKKIVLLVSAICTGCMTVMIVISFLGNALGTFTVSLKKPEEIKMLMSEHSDFAQTTTYLHLNDVPRMDLYTASLIDNHEQIDNEDNNYLYGAERDKQGKPLYLNFLKYTFYLKNASYTNVLYTFNVNVIKNQKPGKKSDGTDFDYDLSDISRVRIYENKDTKHTFKTYAKRSRTSHKTEDGTLTFKEPIAGEYGTGLYCGFANEYISDTNFVSEPNLELKPNETVRYTVVLWLEGEDPQAQGEAPTNCSLELGVDILAYAGKTNKES